MQVSSAILFRVSLFNRFVIEKPLSQITNMEHIFSAKSRNHGNCPVRPPGCGSGYSSIISKLLPCNIRGISRMFSRVWCSLNKNFLGTDITCNPTRHSGLPLLLAKNYLSTQLELHFLFSSDTSLVTLIVF